MCNHRINHICVLRTQACDTCSSRERFSCPFFNRKMHIAFSFPFYYSVEHAGSRFHLRFHLRFSVLVSGSRYALACDSHWKVENSHSSIKSLFFPLVYNILFLCFVTLRINFKIKIAVATLSIGSFIMQAFLEITRMTIMLMRIMRSSSLIYKCNIWFSILYNWNQFRKTLCILRAICNMVGVFWSSSIDATLGTCNHCVIFSILIEQPFLSRL